MATCNFDREVDGGRTTIRLAGTFDRSAALELRERLQRDRADEVDFSLVRDFTDLGVATLAHGLTGMDRLPFLRGLRHHQLRIFRYCGVDVESLWRTSPGDDAPIDRATIARRAR
jgi:hypothetical protein